MTNGKIRLIALIGAFSAAIGGVSVASGVETEAEEGKTQVQASVSPDTSLHQDSQYFEEVFFGLGENVKRLQQNIDNAAYDRVVAAPPNEPSARTEYEQVAEWFVEQVEER